MVVKVSVPVALALGGLVVALGCVMVVPNAFTSALGDSLGALRTTA